MKKNTSSEYDVLVIGGGASGMMAAGCAAARGKRVLLVEKNKQLGEKLKISGGGRCNITNAEQDIRILLRQYGDAEQFLYSPFAQFGVQQTFSFFETLGLPLVVQARKRVFPETEKAVDVCRALERHMRAGNVHVRTGAKVTKLSGSDGVITGVTIDGVVHRAHTYILATGGVSRPETGSTGDGFKWLAKLGHTVMPPTPTIVPLSVADRWVKSLAGVTLSFMKITFFVDGKKQFAKRGKLLFTHFGLSGPLILNAASAVGDLLQSGAVTAHVDVFPDTEHHVLEARIIKVFDANKNKMIKNVFSDIAPRGMSDAILSLVRDLDPETQINSVTKEQRVALMQLLKALPVTVTGLMGFDRAVVADGGVALTEVDMKTMRSKLFSNLFVTGDLLHITRPSGGYSLQLCWTTGFVAGSNA